MIINDKLERKNKKNSNFEIVIVVTFDKNVNIFGYNRSISK